MSRTDIAQRLALRARAGPVSISYASVDIEEAELNREDRHPPTASVHRRGRRITVTHPCGFTSVVRLGRVYESAQGQLFLEPNTISITFGHTAVEPWLIESDINLETGEITVRVPSHDWCRFTIRL